MIASNMYEINTFGLLILIYVSLTGMPRFKLFNSVAKSLKRLKIYVKR